MALNNFSNNAIWPHSGLDQSAQVFPAPWEPGHTLTASNASTVLSNRLSPQMLASMNVDELHHIMKGEMVFVGTQIASMQKEQMIEVMTEHGFRDHIKRKLCEELATKIMESKLVEFTSAEEPQERATIYRARAYIMPDGMTKILREYMQRNN